MTEPFGWTEQANCRSWRLGRRFAGSPSTLGAPASCRLWAGHGGSRKQGEFLKPRHFADSNRLEGGAPRGRPPQTASLCRKLPSPSSQPGKDRIMSFAYMY